MPYPQEHLLRPLQIMTDRIPIFMEANGPDELLRLPHAAGEGSVWPAVLGHAGIDSVQLFAPYLLFTQAGVTYDGAVVFLSGWTGWIPILLLIAALVVTGRLPVRNPPDLAAAEAYGSRSSAAMGTPASAAGVQ